MEFFQYLLEYTERKERAIQGGKGNPGKAFKFVVDDRVECGISHQVKYTSRVENVLSVPVPLEAATNQAELAAYEVAKQTSPNPDKLERVRPRIPLVECLRSFAEAEHIPDFYSSATKMKGPATKTARLGSFPPYLMIQVRKFTLGDDWVPRKLDITLDVPDELDIAWLRATGLQAGELPLPEDDGGAQQGQQQVPAAPAVVIDDALVTQLMEMGFDLEGCKKAVYYTKNAGVEPAMNWVLEHMGDADFVTPLVFEQPKPQAPAGVGEEPANEEGIMMIESMGFSRKQAIKGWETASFIPLSFLILLFFFFFLFSQL